MKRHWSPARIGAGLVIGAWAGLFWFVWAAGRTSLYLSTRTAWLIPMGAILMTIAAVGRLASARIVSGPIDFVDIAAARSVKTAAADLRARAGERVTMDGFVTVDEGDTDRFQLTRFVITCCVADATISYVTVVDAPPGQVANDDWVRVTGTIYPLGSDILVDAETVVPIPPPDDPYLTP